MSGLQTEMAAIVLWERNPFVSLSITQEQKL